MYLDPPYFIVPYDARHFSTSLGFRLPTHGGSAVELQAREFIVDTEGFEPPTCIVVIEDTIDRSCPCPPWSHAVTLLPTAKSVKPHTGSGRAI